MNENERRLRTAVQEARDLVSKLLVFCPAEDDATDDYSRVTAKAKEAMVSWQADGWVR